MNSALLATLSLVASGALHGLLFLGLVRSARGAESARDELAPARFVGNTFEIDTVDAPPQAVASPPPEARSAPEPEAPSDPKPELKRAPPPEAPNEPAPVPPAAPPEPAHREPVLPSGLQPPARAATPEPEVGSDAATPAPPASAPSGAGATEATPEAGAGAPTAASGVAPAYGQDALPASTASFAKAFTRAVPRIASADKVWHGLPLGAAGSAVFDIQVDAQGKVVGQGTVRDKPVPAQHLARIIGRTVLMLRNQTFAHSAEGAAPVSQRFELSAEIRQVPALDDTFAEPEDLRQIGRLVEPTRVRPGKANFTFNSGRQVELTVRLLDP